MRNNSSRFVKTTAKLFVALLAVCMVLTALPLLSPASLPVAKAEVVTYQVTAGTTAAQINTQLNSYTAGTEVNVVLGGNIDFKSTGNIGIIIPTGLSVNLYMNGKTISFSDSSWQVTRVCAIENNGTLNVFSGSPSYPNLASGSANITISNVRNEMNVSKQGEQAYYNIEGIRNNGTLTVGAKVNISLNADLTYTTNNMRCDGSATVAVTGIYNTSNSTSVVLNAAVISASAKATGFTSLNDRGHSRSYAYGVYGGNVTVNGDTKISTSATAGANGGDVNDKDGRLNMVSYDICTAGSVEMYGGTLDYYTDGTCDHDALDKGYNRTFMGGILTKTGVTPLIADGTINRLKSENVLCSHGSITYSEVSVGKINNLPYPGETLLSAVAGSSTSDNDYPSDAITANSFTDEVGNSYNSTIVSGNKDYADDKVYTTPIIRGALEGYSRVHIVYRYWTTSSKSAICTTVVGTDGNVGYSNKPIGDGTNIVGSALGLNGLTDGKLIKTKDAALSYKDGGASKNDYYWKQFNIASAANSAWFSDYNVTSSSNRGTVFKSFVDNTNNSVGAGTTNPIYIFMDYYKVDPSGITASAGANGVATVTYTGEPIKASDCGLAIKDGVTSANYTAEYNVDFTNSELIPVSFTWTGTNMAGKTESGTGELPVNAGTYTVTLNIAEDTTYDPNDCSPAKHKNRRALEYTFTLVIDQAEADRGTLAASTTLTYGQKLKDVLTLSTYTAKGVKNETVNGAFSFTNSSDGEAFKQVGTGNVSVTWTPSYPADASAKNYKATTFTVAYTVNPAALVISPNDAAVTYGNTEFDVPYGITVAGLVGNDDTEEVKAAIAASINYTINVNGSYAAYSPDDVGAGVYDIRARVNTAAVPAVLANYTYSYADLTEGYEIHQLTVSKRGLTVQASAISREYAADNYSVNVSYTITGGKYGVDDVRIPAGTGALSENSAGTREVSGVTRATALALLTGGASANYTISEFTYDTGATLKVEITKAVPSVAVPTVADVYYRRTATLADININTGATSVPGTWQWNDPTINPTVAVSSYTAKFIPTDSVNYDVKTVDVTVNVIPTPVTVSYTGTVEYGDPVPNITAYTYSAVQDPSFDINYVTTSGNITPSTVYTQGAAVNPDGYAVTISAPNYKDAAGNYTFTPANGKIIVTPRNIEFTVENVSIVYGDNFTASASTVNLTCDESRLVGDDELTALTEDGSAPTFYYTTTYRYQDNYNVGTYELKADPLFDSSANYTVTVKNGTLTVNKAPLTIKANNISLAYNSDVPANLSTAYTFVGAKRNEGLAAIVTTGVITVDTNYEKGSPVSAEGYPLTVNVNDATFRNYSVTVENGMITVIKATPEVNEYPTASITYGQSLADAVFTGAVVKDNVPGTFVYGSASTVPSYSADPYTIYTATFVPDDTANYNTVTGLYIPLTVNKMLISGALAVTGIPMNGETLTVDVSGMDPDEPGVYTYAWIIDGETVGNGTTFTLGDAQVGKTITVKATANGYYQGTAEYVTTKIAPVLTNVTEILNTENFDLSGLDAFGGSRSVVYDAQNHPVNVTLKNEKLSSIIVGTITVKYNGSTEIPMNVGSYKVTIDVATPDYESVSGAIAYSPASNLEVGTLEITKAPYTVTVTVADKVYDGFNTATVASVEENGAVTLAGGVKDDVKFDKDNAVFTFDNANVGTGKTVTAGTVELVGASAANYELTVSLANGGKAAITPRTLKVAVAPIAREYEANNYDVDLSFVTDVTTIAPADTSDSVYVNEVAAKGKVDDFHAGQRRVTVSDAALTGAKASNYVLEITNAATATVEIEKAIPSYPIPATGILYYDSGRTLSNVSLGDSRWAWDSNVTNVIPGAGSHAYKAVFTPDDTANYAFVEYEVSFEVLKAPVTVKIASFNVIYGEEEPTYYYTVSGLTGADTKNDLGGYVILNCAYVPGSDVGTYSVVHTGGFTSANYTFSYVPGTVTVAARPVYVTAQPVAREYEAGNCNITVGFSALSNIYGADASNVYLAENTVVGTVANDTAGMKAISYELPALAGSKASNYELTVLNPDLKGEILKAHIPGIVLPVSGTVVFGQRLSTTEFTSSYSGTEYGTFSMVDAMTTPAAVGTFSDVYQVTFTPTNSLNYAAETAYIKLTVTVAELNVAMAIVGEARVDSTLYVSTGSIPAAAEPFIVYRWYRVDNANADVRTGTLVASDSDSYKMKEADAGKFIICEASARANSPYDITGKAVTSATVEKLKLSFWQKIVNWFYRVIASITQLFGKLG